MAMKRRGVLISAIAVILFITACFWFGRPQHNLTGGVALAFVSHGTNQSSTQATFRLYNDNARSIFLSWMIVETNGATGWRVARRLEPNDPRVVNAGKAQDLTVSVPPDPERWRLTVVYGTENRGPVLLMTRLELAIRNRSTSGWQSVGVFTGRDLAVSEVSQ
jgi:hypothetical protein